MPLIHIQAISSNGTVVTEIMRIKNHAQQNSNIRSISPLLIHHSTELDIGKLGRLQGSAWIF